MQRVSGGYTVIETMIFLAISAMLIIMAMTFLGGSEGRTRFSQSMRDMQSKMQDWINDVPTGFAFGTSGNTSCKGPTPVTINNIARVASDPPTCIFLGKAIQFTTDSSSVYAYSVFGSRVGPSGELAANIAEAAPVPAAGTGPTGTGTADLTETYTLSGATLKSISDTTPSVSNSRLGGFYLSLNTDQAIGQNGSSTLKAFQYNLRANQAPNSPAVVDCLENKGACGLVLNEPPHINNWQMCFVSNSNSNTALISVLSNDGKGASVQLEFKAC